MKHMKRLLILLLMFPLHAAFAQHASTPPGPTTPSASDTLKEVEVRGDSILRVNEAIRQTIGREKGTRIGTHP